jgi:GTPase
MTKPLKIAIVGRPNVGKSSLFNRLIGKRRAIVDAYEGTTRDRLAGSFDFFGTNIELIDTGGIFPSEKDPFAKEIEAQARLALAEADGIILVVDGQVGALDTDLRLGRQILRMQRPTVLAINKCDGAQAKVEKHSFYGLGIEQMLGISALHGNQVAELFELLIDEISKAQINLPKVQEDANSNRPIVALLGLPNVGKSTLMNELAHEERCAVSEVAGTTRDAVDVECTFEEKSYLLIDTAGVRKKAREKFAVDKFAAIRTGRTIERADICCLLVDATKGLGTQEKKLLRRIEKEGKSAILLLNKWDLMSGVQMEHALRELKEKLPSLAHTPTLCISAKEGRNVTKIFSLIDSTLEEREKRITTGELNRFLERAVQRHHPVMVDGRRLRIYYMTQASSAPPTFVLFVNNASLMLPSYERYLMGQFREAFGFKGSPLRFVLKGKTQQPKKREAFRPVGEDRMLDQLSSK